MSCRFACLWHASLLLVCTLGLSLFFLQGEAQAQTSQHVVILEVPRGGTQEIGRAIYDTPGVVLHQEGWLFERSEAMGLPGDDNILNNAENLSMVMEKNRTTMIIRCRYSRKENIYQVQFFDTSGRVAKEFFVSGTPKGMPQESAQEVGVEAKEFLKTAPKPGAVVVQPPPKPVDPPPTQPTEAQPATQKEDPPAPASSSPRWLSLHGGLRLFKSSLLIGSSSGAVNNYQSGFFPGYQLAIDAAPMIAMGEPSDQGTLGLSLDFSQGFDTVNFATEMGEEKSVSVGQTRLLAHVGYQSTGQTEVYGGVGLTYLSYTVSEENPALRDLSLTGLVLVGRITHSMLQGKLPLQAGVSVVPFASWGKSLDFYGESSSSFGASGWVKVSYTVHDKISAFGSYTAQMNRTAFVGQGVEQFKDSVAMEFTQLLSLGLQYDY